MKSERDRRANEAVIMEKLSELASSSAVMVSEQKATNEHLRVLNGKVLAHTERFSEQATINALTAKSLTDLQNAMKKEEEREQKNSTFWERNWEKLFWTIFATIFTSAFAYILSQITLR